MCWVNMVTVTVCIHGCYLVSSEVELCKEKAHLNREVLV